MRKRIDAVEAEAELVKGKRILRAEKKKAKGDKLERVNMERSIETLAAGVEAVEKLRDVGEKLDTKVEPPAE